MIREFNSSEKSNIARSLYVVPFTGPPVEVGVTMYVLSISSLSEVKMPTAAGGEWRAAGPRPSPPAPHRTHRAPDTSAAPAHYPLIWFHVAAGWTRPGALGRVPGCATRAPLTIGLDCRSAGGGGRHHVCALYQLRLRSAHGTRPCHFTLVSGRLAGSFFRLDPLPSVSRSLPPPAHRHSDRAAPDTRLRACTRFDGADRRLSAACFLIVFLLFSTLNNINKNDSLSGCLIIRNARDENLN
ncbi:hypothetical protein EVAR_66226_1 [Eumeta japonica]|uniref:Uncharacterized protein n=1 Tax=Eumeta variegata TaxID=151549 RepID=A0A4C2A2X0_EUMVA|nr:hypothetical protein EVAR_66226_1 [Eumeta japonica]